MNLILYFSLMNLPEMHYSRNDHLLEVECLPATERPTESLLIGREEAGRK
jgi:hypothetical protein